MNLFLPVYLLLSFFTHCFGEPTRNFDIVYPNTNVTVNFAGRCNDSMPIEFQTLIIHQNIIYVGATNAILQFSVNDLSLTNTFTSGPHEDSSVCETPLFCDGDHTCETGRTCNPNYNKLLVPYRDRLIACGTLFGSCDLLRLSNLTMIHAKNSSIRCSVSNPVSNFVKLSSQNLDPPLFGTVHVNENAVDQDVYYFALKSNLDIALAPSVVSPFFTLFGKVQLSGQSSGNEFKLGWTSDQYTYFIWTTSDKIRLVRFCNNDAESKGRSDSSSSVDTPTEFRKTTQTQIELKCNNNGASAGNFRGVKFVLGKVYILFQTNQDVTLCSISLIDINENIAFVREMCFNSTNSGVADYIGSATCNSIPQYTNDWATCDVLDSVKNFVRPILGLSPVDMSPEATIASSELEEVSKSFTVTRNNNLFSAFIGTSNGNIVKVSFGNGTYAISECIASNGMIAAPFENIVSDESGESIVALTSNSILQFAGADCERQYPTCSECLASMDSYCGWCVLQNRCTMKSSCDSSDQANRWLAAGMETTHCPFVSDIQPNTLAAGTVTKINLTFSGVKLQMDLDYKCQFSTNQNPSAFPESDLETLDSNPRCSFSTHRGYVIPPTTDHENVTVNIMYDGNKVASGVFIIYECENIKNLNLLTMCTSCVSSRWGCSWCKDTAKCSYASCPSDQATAASQCPVVTGLLETNGNIPVGMERTFLVATDSLYLDFEYTCHYDFCEVEATSPAINQSASEVRCIASDEILKCDKQDSSLRVSLRSGSYVVDATPNANVTVKVFNCSATSTICGQCIAFRETYSECAWCNDRPVLACLPSPTCSSFYVDITECPSPIITSVSPLTGPSDGSTLVTISGQNLGSRVDEIVEVSVAGVNCRIQRDQYISSVRIVCLTQPAKGNRSGVVEIRTSYATNTIRSFESFQYKDVEADRYFPDVVLYSSILTIEGSNLNVGSKASVRFGGDYPITRGCFAERTFGRITCPLALYEDVEGISFSVMIDGYRKDFSNSLTFASVPTYTGSGEILAFRSGGGKAHLSLSSLNGVQTAVLEVGSQQGTLVTKYKALHQGQTVLSSLNNNIVVDLECTLSKTDNSVTCGINKKPPTTRRRRQTADDSFPGSLILNGNHTMSVGPVTYVDDPVLNKITSVPCDSSTVPDGATREQSSALTSSIRILGRNFDLSNADRSDYTVYLKPVETSASIVCTVTHLTSTNIFCNALRAQLDDYRNQDLTIEVSIAELPTLSIQVLYCPGQSLLPIYIAVPLVVILLVVIAVLIWMQRQRSKKQIKEKKLLIKHLEDLENKTRETARNAYYELQLGYMNNLADNLTDRITYMAPELYFTQTLFNLARGHPVLDKTALQNQPMSTMEAIEDWMLLLKNKDFLLTFVKTLEEQKRFTVQEKGNVASLLTVCLLSDMPYYTSIMFDLLAELIHKHVQKYPKLLLRRSESVVEKMLTFWLSITLYDECIMEKSGKPIFLLAKAIHYLVSSAPCDVIALKAVNSLNESTLLGKELSYTNIILNASIEEKETGTTTSSVEVTVVNVDTITQTKMKIIEAVYKGKPYSELPKPDDLDLELYGGSDSKKGVILSDIDSVSAVVNNYKQINTLKHYNVPDKAHVVLKPVGVLTTEAESGSFEKFFDRKNSFSNEVSENNSSSEDPRTPLLEGKTKNIFHLIHPSEEDGANGFLEAENGRGGKKTNDLLTKLINKPMQEIYLTRMVKSKTTLQEYVDGVFNSILRPQPIPCAIRYFFQFLDREAVRHKITDVEVIHIWKTNSLLLRYWVNILKNPEFVFDINKTIVVDSCLNVITQAFMDACTTTNRKLGHDSPSNKLLYAKDAAQYKEMVTEFFKRVQDTPSLKEEDMDDILKRISQQYSSKFNPHVASQQLYQYLFKYKEQMLEAVRGEHPGIVTDVETVINKMEGKTKSETTMV